MCTRRSRGCASASARSASGGPAIRRSQGLRRVRRDLRRLEEVAAERLGRLFRAAALLADRARRSRRYPVLYDWWLSQNTKTAPHLARARDVSRGRDERSGASRRRRSSTRSTRRALRGGDQGHIHFNMSALMKNPDSLDDKLSRSVRRAGARASVSLARCDSALEADGDARTRCRDRRVRADAHAEAGREGVAVDRSDGREWRLDDRGAPRLAQGAPSTIRARRRRLCDRRQSYRSRKPCGESPYDVVFARFWFSPMTLSVFPPHSFRMSSSL